MKFFWIIVENKITSIQIYQKKRLYWAVYYTCPKNFMISYFIQWINNFGGPLMNFNCLIQ